MTVEIAHDPAAFAAAVADAAAGAVDPASIDRFVAANTWWGPLPRFCLRIEEEGSERDAEVDVSGKMVSGKRAFPYIALKATEGR